MAAVVAPNDIDAFIRSQKSKLAEDRRRVRQGEHDPNQQSHSGQNGYHYDPPPLIRDQQLANIQAQQDHWSSTPRGGVQNGNIPPGVSPPRYDEERPLAEKLGEWERRRHAYNQERRKEYNQLVKDSNPRASRAAPMPKEREPEPKIPGFRDDSELKKLQKAQRNAEYNRQKELAEEKLRNRFVHRKGRVGVPQQQQQSPREAERLPLSPRVNSRGASPPPVGYPPHLGVQNYAPPPPELHQRFSPRGTSVEQERLNELERQVEDLRGRSLAERLQEQSPRPPTHAAPRPQQVTFREPSREPSREQVEDKGMSLNISDRTSAEARKREQRNREYNDMMNEKDKVALTRRGLKTTYGSPAYEDILTQKRMEESAYRRINDPDMAPYARDLPANVPVTTLAHSGPPIGVHFDPRLDAAERQLNALESDLEKQKQRLFQNRVGGGKASQARGLLDDENWLQSIANGGKGGGVADELDRSLSRATAGAKKSGGGPRVIGDTSAENYGGALTLGRPDSAQVRKRNQETYKKQLQRQMEDDQKKKMVEKALDKEDVSSGGGPFRGGRSKSVNEGLNFSGVGGSGNTGSTGNLATLKPEGGLPGLSAYANTDDDYFYFASKNPLELSSSGGGGGSLARSDPHQGFGASQNLNHSDGAGGRTARNVNLQQQATPNGMIFSSEEEKKAKNRQQQALYREELQRQADEAKLRKIELKRKQEEYDRKKENEIANYNPYGKGGGGAPLTDASGNVTANLKDVIATGGATSRRTPPPNAPALSSGLEEFRMKLDDSFGRSYGGGRQGGWVESPRAVGTNRPLNDQGLKSPRQTNALGEPTHARGGHGIFGEPETLEQRTKKEKYQDELRLQVVAQQQAKEREKERQRLEDERDQKRLEEQNRRIQQELMEERKKKQEKDDEDRRKNEEIQRQADEKRREAMERRQKEAAAALERAQNERQRQAATAAVPQSPPIHAHRQPDDLGAPALAPAPPLPPPERVFRAPSPEDDVLSQLARMRNQLQQERRKVENALHHQENDVEIYDSRLQNRAAVVRQPLIGRSEIEAAPDAFERARRGVGPVHVKRTTSRESRRQQPQFGDPADPGAVAEFKKFRRQNGSPQDRLRQAYPETPMTQPALEAQQLSLLREQEARLRRMRHGHNDLQSDSRFLAEMPSMNPKDLGLRRPDTRTSVNQLQSDSAFLDTNGLEFNQQGFSTPKSPADLLRLDSNEPYQLPAATSQFGSQASLDIDRLARRNERRLEKLQRLQADSLYTRRGEDFDPDTVSLEDPDAVLNRFMTREVGERPPSGRTLMDDTWMQPGH